ncbi:MAG: hypothetical protein Q9183_004882, partial [Haloplaca sp. 2 TL-2023]
HGIPHSRHTPQQLASSHQRENFPRSMCIVERFNRIHPDGHREQRQRIRHCPYGTPITPCNDTRIVIAMDELVDPMAEDHFPPRHHIIEPRPARRARSPKNRKNPKKAYDGLKLIFDFHIPFTSHNKKQGKKTQKERPRDDRVGRPETPIHVAVPPHVRQQPPPGGYQLPEMSPVPPPPPPPAQRSPNFRPHGHMTPPILVHPVSSSDSSPSPLSPLRDHHRPRARSLSPTRQYEQRKQAQWERERREHAERVAIAEHEARRRAEREAERVRLERDRERRHNEAHRVREQRHIDQQMRHRIEDAERERRRRDQDERDRAAAIIARRRREELDRREARAERAQQEAARLRRHERDRQRRMQEEADRLERQRRAGIPRGPRHPTALHHHNHGRFEHEAREDFERRGDRVIDEAIRADQTRQAPGPHADDVQARWPAGYGLRRRGTIGAAERIVYDDDRRFRGRRWF